MYSKIALALLTFSTVSIVSAQDLYVTHNGGGDQCSESEPCNSIQTAIDQAQANDRIKIRSGTFRENITIPSEKEGLMLVGEGRRRTIIESAGGVDGVEAPAGIPADIIIDIFAKNITVKHLSVLHAEGDVSKHDIGIFVRPPAANTTLRHLKIERLRVSDLQTPPPPSIGTLVMRATRAVIKYNYYAGGYDDHIHLPSSNTLIYRNLIKNADLHGIIIVQEPAAEDGTVPPAIHNTIIGNHIINSGDVGIEVQGDKTLITNNKLVNNIEYGVRICGKISTDM